MNRKKHSGDGIHASAPNEQLRLEVARPSQTNKPNASTHPQPSPDAFRDEPMLTKLNMNVKRIDGIIDFAEFDEIHTALSPSLSFIFNYFNMACCVHS
jgi:hypothetical protein